jgi:hypothetical protein
LSAKIASRPFPVNAYGGVETVRAPPPSFFSHSTKILDPILVSLSAVVSKGQTQGRQQDQKVLLSERFRTAEMKEVMAKYWMELLGPPLLKPLRQQH